MPAFCPPSPPTHRLLPFDVQATIRRQFDEKHTLTAADPPQQKTGRSRHQALRWLETPPARDSLDAATAKAEFANWLRDRPTGGERLPDELIEELTDSWHLNDINTISATCSPHRVALCLLHLRSYYEEEFSDRLAALLPDWTHWLAARNNTTPEFTDRCIPYAQGKPYDQVMDNDINANYLARVTE